MLVHSPEVSLYTSHFQKIIFPKRGNAQLSIGLKWITYSTTGLRFVILTHFLVIVFEQIWLPIRDHHGCSMVQCQFVRNIPCATFLAILFLWRSTTTIVAQCVHAVWVIILWIMPPSSLVQYLFDMCKIILSWNIMFPC